MKVAVLTSARRGTASHHLEHLVRASHCTVALVIVAGNRPRKRWRHLWRKVLKTLRIGLGGALNGVRMRAWYDQDLVPRLGLRDIEEVCLEHGIPFVETVAMNSAETARSLRESGAVLGISLGNGYIGKRVFTTPSLGMVNIHHELLPGYRNAQSIIWQIYNMSPVTGYTIHQIDQHIDTGMILLQEQVPITFGDSLRETVNATLPTLMEASARGLCRLLADYPAALANARPQGPGHSYTTPSLRQFRRMQRNLKRLAKAGGKERQ